MACSHSYNSVGAALVGPDEEAGAQREVLLTESVSQSHLVLEVGSSTAMGCILEHSSLHTQTPVMGPPPTSPSDALLCYILIGVFFVLALS